MTSLDALANEDKQKLSDEPLTCLKTWANGRRTTPEAVSRRLLARTLLALAELTDAAGLMQQEIMPLQAPERAAPPPRNAPGIARDEAANTVARPRGATSRPPVASLDVIVPKMIAHADVSVPLRRLGWEILGPFLAFLLRLTRMVLPSLQHTAAVLCSGLLLHLLTHPEAAVSLAFQFAKLVPWYFSFVLNRMSRQIQSEVFNAGQDLFSNIVSSSVSPPALSAPHTDHIQLPAAPASDTGMWMLVLLGLHVWRRQVPQAAGG